MSRAFQPMTQAERRRVGVLMRRVERARNKSTAGGKYAITCGASRHLHIMADCLLRKPGYPMLQEEPVHCAESILAVLACLWELRAKDSQYERAIDKAIAKIDQQFVKGGCP